MDLKEADSLGESVQDHWYYQAKAAACHRLLSNASYTRILDIGAGSGFFSRDLLRHSPAKEAWCVDTSYKRDEDTEENLKPLHFRREIPEISADLILLMDVLEHIEDDHGFLKSCVNQAPSGSTFLISVPAFQWLWSQHDIFLEHKRRYSLSNITSLATNSGLITLQATYFFAGVLPIAGVTRLAQRFVHSEKQIRSQLVKHHPFVNQLLRALCQAELSILTRNKIGGLTVFYLGVKP